MEQFSNVQLDLGQIPKSERLEYEAIDTDYIKILLCNATIMFMSIVGGLILLWALIEESWFANNFPWFLILALLFYIINIAFIYKAFQFKGYALRQKDLSYKTGWLWRSMTTVPFNRVQHCEVSQGVLDRFFGLARLKIFTAGGSSSDVTVPGLDLEIASELKNYILEKIKEDE